MDAITQFQQQLSGPILGFVAAYWYAFLFLFLAVAGFFVLPESMKEDRAPFDLALGDNSEKRDDGDGD